MFQDKLVKLLSEAKKNGVTAQSLADALGVKKNTISNWKNGRCSPTPDVITKIAKFFNVKADYLLKSDEEETHDDNNKIYGNNNTIQIGNNNQVATSSQLSTDEAEFLQLYRSLTPAQRSAFINLAKTLK